MTFSTGILLTLLLGFAPPLLWLWFWLREDVHPEPKSEIALVFSMGMAVVLMALIAEKLFANLNISQQSIYGYSGNILVIINIIAFAFFEEIAKTIASFFTAIRSRYFDEPIDAMIYAITASLGFAALENAFCISKHAFITADQAIAVSSVRFIGAILIHASTGAIIGASFAFSFCKRSRRAVEFAIALVAATALHAIYNYYVMGGANNGKEDQIAGVIIAGIGAVFALILFERAKRLRALCE